MELTIPVSLGELLDKYSILEIKSRKITEEEKLVHVRAEMKELDDQVQPWLKIMPHYYRYLVHINETIWDLSDAIRVNPQDTQKCMDIITHNDRRFRVKNKINKRSLLKEQKSYPKTSCIFMGHCGAGDCFTNTGIVRYLSTCYDKVLVCVEDKAERLSRYLYADDDSIEIKVENRASYGDCAHLHLIKEYENQENVYMVSTFKADWNPAKYVRFYDYFYIDLGIPPEYRISYGYIPRSEKQVESPSYPYAFVHQRRPPQPVNTTLPIIQPEHHIFITDYMEMMENAEELHLDDSSFFCLASLLDLSRVKKLYVRGTTGSIYEILSYCHPQQKWTLI